MFGSKGNLAEPKVRADTGKAAFLNKITGAVAAQNLAHSCRTQEEGVLYISSYREGAVAPQEHKLAIRQLANGDTRIETISGKVKDATDEHFALIFDAQQRLVCVEDRVEQMVFPKAYEQNAAERDCVPAPVADLYIKRLEKILAKHQQHTPIEALDKQNLAAPSAREGGKYAFIQNITGPAAAKIFNFQGKGVIEDTSTSAPLHYSIAGQGLEERNLSIRQKNGFTSIEVEQPNVKKHKNRCYIFDAQARLIAADIDNQLTPPGFPHVEGKAAAPLLDANPEVHYPLLDADMAKKAMQDIESVCKRHLMQRMMEIRPENRSIAG